MSCRGLKLLGDLVIARTYSKKKEDGSIETWEDIVTRYLQMMTEKYPFLKDEITKHGESLYKKHVVPSMRAAQFAGKAILDNHARIYNCAALKIKETQDFGDFCYLLMSGCGVSDFLFSEDIEELPVVSNGFKEFFPIPDTREGWADSFVALIKNPDIFFNYGELRLEGSALSSGGHASGPKPLKEAHKKIRDILQKAKGRKLTTLEVFDINGHIAGSILAGGVRRSARLCGFNPSDESMLQAKNEEGWQDNNPQRYTANISQCFIREDTTEAEFKKAIQITLDSSTGEPGILWTDKEKSMISNPCGEISINSHQFCNLSEIILPNINNIYELFQAAESAAFFGTLQAGFTDFKYISPKWKATTEAESLLGVSLTGIAQSNISELSLHYMSSNIIKDCNIQTAKAIGINPAARLTTIKPSGSTSASFGCSPGVHAEWPYVLRKVLVDKKSKLGKQLYSIYGLDYKLTEGICFLEQSIVNSQCYVINAPLNYKNVIDKDEETAIEFLERMKSLYQSWIRPGHNSGLETHNISATCVFEPHEKEDITNWLWENRDYYRGISFLPKSNHTYIEPPFTKITEEKYKAMIVNLPELDVFSLLLEDSSKSDNLACSGGNCEVKNI